VKKLPLILGLLLVSVLGPARASIVIHDGQPGIVALYYNYALDDSGRYWDVDGNGWRRNPALDPPIPVAQIKFWSGTFFVTMDNQAWQQYDSYWHNLGSWPASAVPEAAPAGISPSPGALPNPSPGSCRIAFQTVTAGPVSVRVFDASGRQVRQLHDGPLPAGEFSLLWDGRDDGGRELPSGVYFAKIQTTSGSTTAKVTLTK
jgi:hypothetical protein